jgi:hypothetical protein
MPCHKDRGIASLISHCHCRVECKRGTIHRLKYWEITTVMLMAGLAVTSAQAQLSPITVECTFTHVDPVKLRLQGYSNTKVGPKDMAWLRPGDVPYMRPGEYTTQLGFVVLGNGTGHLTASTDLRKLCTQFAKLASDHGANAISCQIFNQGTQIRIQFLRVEDAALKRARGQQNPPQ